MTRNAVQGSRVLQWMMRTTARGRARLAACRAWAAHQPLWRHIDRTWRIAPLRAVGVLLITAVLTNAAWLWRFGRAIDGWGVAQRLLLLAIGWLAATTRPRRWRVVRQGSWWFRPHAPP